MTADAVPFDYRVQVDTVVDDSIIDLLERFPERTEEDFDVRLRTFVPTLDIFIRRGDYSDGEVFETVGYGSAQAEAKASYQEGTKVEYRHELLLQQELRRKEFNYYIQDKIKELVVQDGLATAEELDHDYRLRNRLLSDRFLQWIGDTSTDNVALLVDELRPQYRAIFSRFDTETLIEHMKSTLLRTFERRFRAAKVREFVDSQHSRYAREFTGHRNLKAKIYAVVKWYEEYSATWCKTQLFPECRLLEERPGLFRKLEGNENVLVTEIVPSDLTDYWGEVGGKTIKICSYGDLNVQFYMTEGLEIDEDLMSEKRLKELRDSFLRTIVARRYIFGDAIDQILNYTVQHTGMKEDIERLSNDTGFRELRYKLFYDSSKIFLGKIYDHVIKRLSATERRRTAAPGNVQSSRSDRRSTD